MKVRRCYGFYLRCVLETYAISIFLVYLLTDFKGLSGQALLVTLGISFVLATVLVYIWALIYPSDDFIALKREKEKRN
ncbi:hypothetical protein [Thermococcus sp. ES12]|uniref:hypothetical protein n=1 Tax=Thermococcus sp. ES12 TaxID=1638246 RepID=UPI00142FA488|nr:hypothetical protein [Thermococcus sp. ES12]NJE76754.1 hypothetical protein [Thermococcus sp. ES12]